MLTLLLITNLLVLLKVLFYKYPFKKRNTSTGSLFLLLLIGCGSLSAQSTEGLFQRDTSLARRSVEANPTGGTILLLDEDIVQDLIAAQPEEITLTLPSDEVGDITLLLKKRQLFTEDFRARSSEANAVTVLDLHYTGAVEGAVSYTHLTLPTICSV